MGVARDTGCVLRRHDRLAARRDHQRALARDRGGGGVRNRVPFLLALHRRARDGHRRRPGDARVATQRRARLRADRAQRAVRPPLRRDRRRRPAGRPRTRRADGLPAGHPVDPRRSRVRGRRAGHAGALLLDAARRAFARRDDPKRNGCGGGRDLDDRDPDDHGDPAGGAGARRGQGARAEPVGHVHRRDDDPDRPRDGPLPARLPPRPGARGVAAGARAAAAVDLDRRPGRRRSDLGTGVHARGHDAGMAPGRLRVRRGGAARVAVARASRLSFNLPQDRHGAAAGGGDRDRAPRPADAGADAVRRRYRAGVRRAVVSVPVHHHRLRRGVGLPCARVVGHDAEDDRE